MKKPFDQTLDDGIAGEVRIARWLVRQGMCIFPIYAQEGEGGFKGPRVLTPDGELIGPDLFVANRGRYFFAECKTKDRFSWFGITGHWQTGIDARMLDEYVAVEHAFGLPVMMFFLHRRSDPSLDDLDRGCEAACPTGLFSAPLQRLVHCIDHQLRDQHGALMCYWNIESLDRLATLDAFMAVLDLTATPPSGCPIRHESLFH